MDNYRIDWSRLRCPWDLQRFRRCEEMIKMRKLLTLLFAVAVALSLSMPAMAEENGEHHRHEHHKHHRHHRKHDKDRSR
jgi:hypothetical protein